MRDGSTKCKTITKRVVLCFCPILKDESLDPNNLFRERRNLDLLDAYRLDVAITVRQLEKSMFRLRSLGEGDTSARRSSIPR